MRWQQEPAFLVQSRANGVRRPDIRDLGRYTKQNLATCGPWPAKERIVNSQGRTAVSTSSLRRPSPVQRKGAASGAPAKQRTPWPARAPEDMVARGPAVEIPRIQQRDLAFRASCDSFANASTNSCGSWRTRKNPPKVRAAEKTNANGSNTGAAVRSSSEHPLCLDKIAACPALATVRTIFRRYFSTLDLGSLPSGGAIRSPRVREIILRL